MSDTELPAWVESYAQDCRRLLGIGDDWHITIKLVRAPDDDLDREGHSSVNVRYLSARIWVCNTLSEEGIRATLMHELMHVAFAPIEQYHLRIRELVREELREHADELQADGIEQVIERMVRALQRTITPPLTEESKEGQA